MFGKDNQNYNYLKYQYNYINNDYLLNICQHVVDIYNKKYNFGSLLSRSQNEFIVNEINKIKYKRGPKDYINSRFELYRLKEELKEIIPKLKILPPQLPAISKSEPISITINRVKDQPLGIKLQPQGNLIVVQGYSSESGPIYESFKSGMIYPGLLLVEVNNQSVNSLADAKNAMSSDISFFYMFNNLILFKILMLN